MEQNFRRPVGLVAASLLLIGGAALGVSPGVAVAQEAPPAASSAPAASALSVKVEDPSGLLSASDVTSLVDGTTALSFPDAVHEVTYMVFNEYSQGLDYETVLSDQVQNYSREQRPDLITGSTFNDGKLIIATGYLPNFTGVYCGNDVCDALDLWPGKHLTNAEGAGKTDFKHLKTVDGLLAMADAVVTPEPNPGDSGVIFGAIIGGAVVLAAAGGGSYVLGRRRKKRAEEARSYYGIVMAHYPDVDRRLDAIDVRAHSLTSQLADENLLKDWEEVRDKFVELRDDVQALDSITADSDDATFRSKYKLLKQAAETTKQVATAGGNIDMIYLIEQGDNAARLQAADELSHDMLKAQTVAKNEVLQNQARSLSERADDLRDEVEADDFLDQYVRLLGDCALVVELIDEQEFSKFERTTEREVPRVYDSDYRVGTGVNHYIPFSVVFSWHQHDVDVHKALRPKS
ncbi:hypothetical protein ACXZ66_05130 [Corynebacterium sp. S7]